MAENKLPHSGHRDRMRRRYLETGFSGFQPHEVLEIMLFYAIPRKDTNLLAHQLLDRYGSVYGVLKTPPEELAQVPGISFNAAVLLSMFSSVFRYGIAEQKTGTVLNTFQKSCNYFKDLYYFETNEVVRAVMLDESLRAVRCEIISEGHPSSAALPVRKLIDTVCRSDCNLVIIAHNHPRGTLQVSPEDIAVTRHLVELLSKAAIKLIDHVLVAEEDAMSMREAGVFIGLEID